MGRKARRDHFGYPTRRAYRDAKHGDGYDSFRTGLTFAQAHRMMHVGGDDPARWKYHRRHGVLGFMHDLKQQLWEQVLEAREAEASEGTP